jgi:bifunctional UDP-N-acetylglucosamine pyrophosphorylase/glucosamine-1-phosphate N-acetyltransferase
MTLAVLILAAGHGTRMNSRYQKVLHHVGGKPMVQHVFDAVKKHADRPPVVVVGAGEQGVQQLLGAGAAYVVQAERLGTGHATQIAREALTGRSTQLLVTYGDMPLIRSATIQRLCAEQARLQAAVMLLAVSGAPDSPFGRIVRGPDGHVVEILEAANARRRPDAAELLAISEQNAGLYCFDAAWLWANVDDLPLRQARSGPEYYLTDMIELAVKQGRIVEAVLVDDPDECLGAGTRAELVDVERAFRRRAAAFWLANGVTLVDPATTYIDADVVIGQDTIIWPNTFLQGATRIGSDCILGPNTVLRDAVVGHGCRIELALVDGVVVPDGETVRPFSRLRAEP